MNGHIVLCGKIKFDSIHRIRIVLPDSEKLWLLSWGAALALHLQRVDVCNGDDRSCYIPGQAHEGAHSHQDTHPEQVQVVATTFLKFTKVQRTKVRYT